MTVVIMKTSPRQACFGALILSVLAIVQGAEAAGSAEAADVPWKINQTSQAIYPPRLMRNGVTHGEARVRVSISAAGKLTDALVVACTHRDFGNEALRTVARWRFEPEWVKGQPIGIVADIVFAFEVNGPVAIERRSPAPNEEQDMPLDPFAYKAEGLKNLDHIPTPTQVVAPIYPKDWSDRGIVGSATVEFYIDQSGKARIPVVTSADHSLLGASAVAAVSQWHFEPPTRAGKPVLVRAEQIFTFQPVAK
jgi:TonB family protein